MTPKEKAEELIDKFRSNIISFLSDNMKDQNAKQCALIAVDEIFFALKYNLDGATSGSVKYWQEVKQEIKNL